MDTQKTEFLPDIQNMSSEDLKELSKLYALQKEGRIKIKGEVKSREELLAYNHYRQNRLNHYINAMFEVIKQNDLINDVKMFDKTPSSYLDKIKSILTDNPDAKISKGKKASLPEFAVFEK